MLLRPQQLKCNIAGVIRGRFQLNAIALTDKGAISADGYTLLFVPHPEVDASEAPNIEGVNPQSPPPNTPFLVNPEEAAQAAAALVAKAKKNGYASEWTQLIQAEVVGDMLVLGATDLSNTRVATLQKQEGDYPEVGGVIPDYANAVSISFEIDRLLGVARLLRGASASNVVTLRIIDGENGVGFSCEDGVAAMVMPYSDNVPDKLAAIRDPDAAAKRAMEQGPPGLFLAPPQPESEMLPAKVFSDND